MILDSVIQKWCREGHDTSREAEFLAYAKYVAIHPWIRGLRLHSIFLWLVFALMMAAIFPSLPVVEASTVLPLFLQIMAINGVCTLAFIPYGFKKYHLGDGTTPFFYILMVIAINWIYVRFPQAGQYAFSLIMMPVSLVLHHVLPFMMNKNARQMKKFHAEQQLEADEEKAQMDKAEFDSWTNRQQSAGFQDTAELPDDANQGYWAIQNWADVVGRVEAMHQDADCMELIPDEPPQGMLEEFASFDDPNDDYDEPDDDYVDPLDQYSDLLEDGDDDDY